MSTKPRRDPGYKRLSDSELNARALENRSRTYADDNARSWRFAQDRVTDRPITKRALIRWAQREFRLEPPTALHEDDLADDGSPDFTGQARSYLGMSHGDVGGRSFESSARPTDWTSVACQRDEEGNYVTPMRCALERVRRTDPERGKLLRAIVTREFADEAAAALDVGVPPAFCDDVVVASLNVLYDRWSPMPRGRPRKKENAQEVAAA